MPVVTKSARADGGGDDETGGEDVDDVGPAEDGGEGDEDAAGEAGVARAGGGAVVPEGGGAEIGELWQKEAAVLKRSFTASINAFTEVGSRNETKACALKCRDWLLTYIHTYIHTYMHTYTHTYMHTYTHTYTNVGSTAREALKSQTLHALATTHAVLIL